MKVLATNAEFSGQVCAFFAQKNGGKIDSGKLLKLIYLANRQCMREVDHPLYFDTIVGTNAGPIMIETRKRINNANFINEYIRLSGRDVEALDNIDFDWLSEYSIDLLTRIWDSHGHQDNAELIYYMTNLFAELPKTHLHMDVDITHLDILKALNKDMAEAIYDEILAFKRIDDMFCL